MSPGLPQFLLWEWKLEKQALAALSGDLSTHVHNTHTHTICQIYLRIGYAARKPISGIAGLAK